MKSKKGASKLIEFLIVAALLGLFFLVVSYVFIGQGIGKTAKDAVMNGFNWVGEKFTSAIGGMPAEAGGTGTGGTGEEGGRKTYTLSVGSGGGVHTTPGGAGEYTVTLESIDTSANAIFSVIKATGGQDEITASRSDDGCSDGLNICIDVLSVDMDTDEVSFQVYAMTGEAGQEIVYGETTRVYKDKKYPISGKGYTLEFYKTEGNNAWFWLDTPSGQHQNCDAGLGKDWWIKYTQKCHTCCKADQSICGVVEGIVPDGTYLVFKLCNPAGSSDIYCGAPGCP